MTCCSCRIESTTQDAEIAVGYRRGMTTDPAEAISVSPGQGRPGQRIANVLAWWTTPVLVVVPAMLVRAGLVGDGLCLLGLFSLLLGATAHQRPRLRRRRRSRHDLRHQGRLRHSTVVMTGHDSHRG